MRTCFSVLKSWRAFITRSNVNALLIMIKSFPMAQRILLGDLLLDISIGGISLSRTDFGKTEGKTEDVPIVLTLELQNPWRGWEQLQYCTSPSVRSNFVNFLEPHDPFLRQQCLHGWERSLLCTIFVSNFVSHSCDFGVWGKEFSSMHKHTENFPVCSCLKLVG